MTQEKKIKRLTKKQKKDIARIWAANILYACGTNSFDIGMITPEDEGEIVNIVHLIADKMIDESEYLQSLSDIIDFVKNKSREEK